MDNEQIGKIINYLSPPDYWIDAAVALLRDLAAELAKANRNTENTIALWKDKVTVLEAELARVKSELVMFRGLCR